MVHHGGQRRITRKASGSSICGGRCGEAGPGWWRYGNGGELALGGVAGDGGAQEGGGGGGVVGDGCGGAGGGSAEGCGAVGDGNMVEGGGTRGDIEDQVLRNIARLDATVEQLAVQLPMIQAMSAPLGGGENSAQGGGSRDDEVVGGSADNVSTMAERKSAKRLVAQ